MRLIIILTLDIEKDKNKLKVLLFNSNNNSPNRIIKYVILLNQWIIIMISIDSLKDKGKFHEKEINVIDERKKVKNNIKRINWFNKYIF